MPLDGDQLVRLVEQLPAILAAAAALVTALSARRKAQSAQETADDAIEQAKEAAREQVHFALRDAAKRQRPAVPAGAPGAASAAFPAPNRKEGGAHE